METVAGLYRLLGDQVRLRLLRVLAADRFNVTELTAILGIAQSGVSRHLGLLKEAGLVVEEREGGFTFYRLAPADRDGQAPLWTLLHAQFAGTAGTPAVRADDSRRQEVLRLRKENFETHGLERHQLVPGRSWAAWARAVGRLLPPLDVADLGCGEGYLTIEAARWARRVTGIDRSEQVLRRARALARRRRVSNIIWRRGRLEHLPLRDASVDVALLSQALHHAEDPKQALQEAWRVVTPGGRVLVLDLRHHDQTWVRDRLGDRWLGFTDQELGGFLNAAGFERVEVGVGARRTGDPFTVLIASGTKKKVATGTPRRRRSHPGNAT